MSNDLKQKAVNSMIWSSVGKIGTLGLNFISNLVLARLLMPNDYGTIGMLYIFIAISNILVNAGFASALIQKKEVSHIDYTSVFYWNLGMSLLTYLILFVSAPYIASFYRCPELRLILRVQSLSLIINAFSTVQATQLQKTLQFKQLSIRTVVATLCGTIAGIGMAMGGMGVWSLVASGLISSTVGVLLLWSMSTWRPTYEFSWDSLKELFSFGGLMALSGLVETLYTNLQGLIIGRWYSPADLGFYSQAKKLEDIPTTALSQIVNQVAFPVFSSLQDDVPRLLSALRKNVKAITYVNFPLMVLFIVLARPIILFLYGAKWETSIPYFQILCISSMVYTHNTLNTTIIKSLGKSKLFFIVQLIKRLIGIIMIVVGSTMGIYGLLWAVTLFSHVCLLINIGINKRLINYGYWDQITDVGVNYLLSVIIGVCVGFLLHFIILPNILEIIVGGFTYIALYLIVSKLLQIEAFNTYLSIMKNMKIK